MLLPFVQLEYAGRIGLPEGRYLARDGGEPEQVLIVQELGAPRPGRRRRRRPRKEDPGEPETVPVTRVTLSGGEEFGDRAAAERWLGEATGAPEARAERVRSLTLLANRALAAIRAESRDPLVQEIGATRALAVRIGFATGEELAEHRWSEAKVLPPPPRGKLDDIDPLSRVAAVLAGRDEVHPAETLLERARLDTEQGRVAEAAFGLGAARAALTEIPAGERAETLGERIDQAELALQERAG